MDHLQCCDLLEAEVTRFAALVDPDRLGTPVPSCPGWSVRDLVVHLGTVHRWAEHLVRARAPERIDTSAMGLGEPDPSAAWLRAGGQILVATLREADPEAPMWAWGQDQHARFWSRRQLHETLVHRMDAELAFGRSPYTSPEIADDGIDELLVNLPRAAYFSPKVKNIKGDGARLCFRASDQGRTWTVALREDGFEIEPGTSASPGDATVEAPALDLLLVLYRRLSPTSRRVVIAGDKAVVELWWENSALE